ncbi:pilus assembly protein PilY [Archangium sp.]|jgi:type IV pilus assembly protein PilY1|uniref:pilus assembly protein PilY n=1 Tax=Archangium sp. TaxID=1872627 RepID=UPI002ED898C3
MSRKLTLSLVALSALSVVLLRADTASAIDQAACCLPTTSRLDALMNPIKGGDEKFFSRPGGPPNILFVIDTSGSMHNWPKAWPETKGCSDTFLNGLGYDKAETYDRLWTGINTQSNEWWATEKYYDAPKEGYGVLFGSSPTLGKNPADDTRWTPWTSAADACKTLPGIGSDQGTCESCLANQGYYVQDKDNRRVKGNFLNFYAPRDSGAVKVLADVVRDLREVRFGVMGFETRDTKTCWGKKGRNDAQCLCMQQPMGPTCDKSYPLDNSSVEHNRNAVLNALTNVNASNKIGLGWGSCNTPLADALYSAGYLFQSKSPAAFPSTYPASDNFSAADSVCFECGFNAIILLTDGEPSEEGDIIDLPDDIENAAVSCPDCSKSNLHKVAKFLWEKDLRADMAGQQRVATYTIGFSEDVSDSKLLMKTAEVGGGRFFPATSTSELKRVILSILDDINARNTSFSSAAVSTLQTQSAALTAVVPRMLPAKDKAWQGKLYRYEQYNEFVEDVDKNKDGDKNDLFLIDSEDSIVAEDSTNEYHKLVSQNGGPGGTPVFGGDAKPFWEASQKIKDLGFAKRNIWTVTDNGNAGGGGKKDGLLTNEDALVKFDLENITELRQYLAVTGAPLCPSGQGATYKPGLLLERMNQSLLEASTLMTLSGLKNLPVLPTKQEEYDLLCTALVIQYVRGQDIFDEDGDNLRLTDTRPHPLGDIFHSSPVVVDPPVDKFLCDLGISNQCVRTLYDTAGVAGVESTKLLTRKGLQTSCTITGKTLDRDAYDAYQYVNRKRERLILVGANDGMLHAFRDGLGNEHTTTCDISYPSVTKYGGDERWAFIPADMLSRLQEMLQGHAYYVDGDIMVRDVWADEDGDGEKKWDEYRTVALVAEGRGGTHYFALEMRWMGDDFEKTEAQPAPGFRWMFPQPCSDESLRFGKTIVSLSPKPPPIGPVLLDPQTVKSPKGTTLVGQERHGKGESKSTERWVAMLSGGWSPGGEKGRGLYMVDVWNGTVNGRRDNLLWKWEFSEAAAGDTDEPRKYMTYGFAAPVALADYGSNKKQAFDGFFDTAVAGDLGGQLWTLRFHEPGVLDSDTKLIKNWSGGRSFVMDRDGQDTSNQLRISDRSPFYYLPSLVMQQDNQALRAFIGTGNRYSLLENGAGICRFDNPQACSKLGCGTTAVTYKLTRNDTEFQRMSNAWTDRTYTAGKFTPWGNTAPANFCSTAGDTDFLKAEFEERKAMTCPTPTGKDKVGYEFARTKVDCGQNAAGVYDCRVREAGNTLNMSDLDVNPTSTADTLGKNRYFGIWVYGGIKERMFDETSSSNPTNKAKQYDWLRLSDTGGTKGTGSLVDVTNVQCDALGNCKCAAGKVCPGNPNDAKKVVAGTDDMGWFYEYDSLDHKTASGSSVLASCALWNSMYPGPSSGGACAGSNSNLARLHQADFLTGAPNCAAGFLGTTGYARYQDRTVLAPPPEPGIAIQVSKTGQVKYSTVFVEPGKPQATEVQLSSDMDVLQYIYELPVSQGLHSCRHVRDLNGSTAACIPSEM